MSDQIPHRDDWLRFHTFLQAWHAGSLTEEDWVYRRLKDRVYLTCTRMKIRSSFNDVFHSSLIALANARHREEGSFHSYTSNVVSNEAKKILKQSFAEDRLVEKLTPNREAALEIWNRLMADRNMRRLSLTQPELNLEILKSLVGDEEITPEKLEIAVPTKDQIERVKTEFPNVSERNVRAAFEVCHSALQYASYRFTGGQIFVLGSNDKEQFLVNKIRKLSNFKQRERYDELYEKFEDDEIGDEEEKELRELNRKRELQQAERLEAIRDLAELRGVSLKEVLDEFRPNQNPFHTIQSGTHELRAT